MFILWLLIFSSHNPWRKCTCIRKPLLNRMQIEAEAQSSRRQIRETISLHFVILLVELWVLLVSWIRQLQLIGLWTQNSAITPLIWLMKALKRAVHGHRGLVSQSLGNHSRSAEDEFILRESHSRGCPVPLQCLHMPSAPLPSGVTSYFWKLSFLGTLQGYCHSKLSLNYQILGR